MSLEKVCIVGSGNWGSTVAKIIGENVQKNPQTFHPIVEMWVYEELINGNKLTDIINTKHENVKYLPNVKLPVNVHANPDLIEAALGATLLGMQILLLLFSPPVFVIPHSFLSRTCDKLALLKFDKEKVSNLLVFIR
jgi:glycerol-3-phosphate dehydrogenase (NAD+)